MLGETPLHRAVVIYEESHSKIVKLLLEWGADRSLKDDDQQTAIALAKKKGRLGHVDMLLKSEGMRLQTRTQEILDEMTTSEIQPSDRERASEQLYRWLMGHLFCTDEEKNEEEEALSLLSGDPATWPRFNGKRTVLHVVARSGAEARLHSVLINDPGKFCINEQDEWGQTPLHRAAYSANEPSIRWLILAGANINAPDSLGNTALHIAAVYNNEIIDVLARNGAIHTTQNKAKQTPLDICEAKGLKDELLAAAGKFARHHGDRMPLPEEEQTPIYPPPPSWDKIENERSDPGTFEGNYELSAYLLSPRIPSSARVIRRIHCEFKSRDEGSGNWYKQGTYEFSESYVCLTMHRQGQPQASSARLTVNRRGMDEPFDHVVGWDAEQGMYGDGSNRRCDRLLNRVREFATRLREGDQLAIEGWTQYESLESTIESAKIEIYFTK